MLVLSRRLHQKIVIPSIQTTVQIVAVKPGTVRLGIDAPEQIAVYRQELLDRTDLQAAAARNDLLPKSLTNDTRHLLNNLLNANTVGLALLRRQLALGRTGEMSGTLDKIESNLRNIQQRTEDLDVGHLCPARLAKRRALIVEDDRNECELLAGFLRLAGLDVHTAGDGAAALDYLNVEGKPDFVLLDMLLPRCDGPTTVRAIRGNPAYTGLRIFGVTGAPVEQFGLDEGPGGIDHWFRKPLNPEILLRELGEIPPPEEAMG
ncbi:MAG TPA: carbon storage regulator [Gemmataceae bacterium]|nr:carbon storage regulator [Gemmataceae bacterium]